MSEKKVPISHVVSGTLLIAGTTIGAGMLGIPLITTQGGFLPAALVTFLVWVFMYATGILFLEATLWMPEGANVLSMSKRFLGKKGRFFAGATFIFLYYCLMIAYFAAGSPLLAAFLKTWTGISLTGWYSTLLFGIVFGGIVGLGIRYVNRVNYILMVGLVASYVVLIGMGSTEVSFERLESRNWSKVFLAAPILFSSFGYHNIIPSLTTFFYRNGRVLRHSIFFGTLIPLIVYLLWQWLIIGAIPKEVIEETLSKGEPITQALSTFTAKPWIPILGRIFGLFAIITSMLGVAFSTVDFLGDGFKVEKRVGWNRFWLCLLTFLPPFIIASFDPSIFVLAIGVAGGFGEAFLNGLLPVSMVWVGRYWRSLKSDYILLGSRFSLILLFLAGLAVVVLEILFLMSRGEGS